jgi:hypothetical protein
VITVDIRGHKALNEAWPQTIFKVRGPSAVIVVSGIG